MSSTVSKRFDSNVKIQHHNIRIVEPKHLIKIINGQYCARYVSIMILMRIIVLTF